MKIGLGQKYHENLALVPSLFHQILNFTSSVYNFPNPCVIIQPSDWKISFHVRKVKTAAHAQKSNCGWMVIEENHFRTGLVGPDNFSNHYSHPLPPSFYSHPRAESVLKEALLHESSQNGGAAPCLHCVNDFALWTYMGQQVEWNY